MNHTNTLQKLVSLLGRSENDPEVIEMFTQLGVKLPLKRPKRSEDGYLIEKSEINFCFGVAYAHSLPMLKENKNFKEKELFFLIFKIYFQKISPMCICLLIFIGI